MAQAPSPSTATETPTCAIAYVRGMQGEIYGTPWSLGIPTATKDGGALGHNPVTNSTTLTTPNFGKNGTSGIEARHKWGRGWGGLNDPLIQVEVGV